MSRYEKIVTSDFVIHRTTHSDTGEIISLEYELPDGRILNNDEIVHHVGATPTVPLTKTRTVKRRLLASILVSSVVSSTVATLIVHFWR